MPEVVLKSNSCRMEVDLKLHGDKIKLESRPVSRESTASSRSAYLVRGPSRPVSAVPHLALYGDKEEYAEVGLKSRRPYSADNFPSKSKRSGGDSSNLQSIEELNKDLPSTELLKTLISEPIVSWRGGLPSSQRNAVNHTTNLTYKSDDDTSTSFEDIRSNDKCHLKPGITTKPPLPKKIKSDKDVRFEITEPIISNHKFPQQSRNKKYTKCKMITSDYDMGYKEEEEFSDLPSQENRIYSHTNTSLVHNETAHQLIERNGNHKISKNNKNYSAKSDESMSPNENVWEHEIDESSRSNKKLLEASEKQEISSYAKIAEVPNQYQKYSDQYQKQTDEYRIYRTSSDQYQKCVNDYINQAGQNQKDMQQKQSDEYKKRLLECEDQSDGIDGAWKRDSNKTSVRQLSGGNYGAGDCFVPQRHFGIVDEIETLSSSRRSRHNAKQQPIESKITDYAAELEEISSALAQIEHPKESNPPDLIVETLEANTAEAPVQYQNWVDDHPESAERQTNLIFEKLKQQQKELEYKEGDVSKVEYTERQTDELLDKLKQQQDELGIEDLDNPKLTSGITFERFFADVPPIDIPSEKTITLHERALEKPKPAKQTNGRRKPDSKPKPAVKFVPKQKQEPLKPKFVAKSMRCVKDYVEKMAAEEDASWMSRPEREILKAKPKEDVISKKCDHHEPDEKLVDAGSDSDDIAAILEVLEAESKKSKSSIQSIKNIVSTELNAAINSIPKSSSNSISSSSSSEVTTTCENDELRVLKDSVQPSTNNFKEILCFLDEVERNSSQSLTNAKERVIIATQLIEGSMRLETIPKQEDLMGSTQTKLSEQIVDLHLRLKEKSSAVRTLQDELSTIREQVIRMTRQTERTVREKLKAQKEEAESTVKRHQKFIDQLIAEKTSLGRQCEGLVRDMRGMEERFEANAKAAEHRHKVELQKAKEMHAAGEKIRRERWLDSKTQKIKEMTVKSIEPEILSMTVRHEQELADVRSLHKREIEDIDLKNARKTQQQCESLRAQLTEEREKALAHEREVMRIRYESIIESEEKSYQDQRKRLLQEHGNRMNDCEAREKAAVAETDRVVKQVHDEYEDKLQAVIRRHTNEIKMLKETTELDLETWKNNWRKQQEAHLAAKEGAIREQCRKERDREIEMVIERLEAEANETRIQSESATENRIRRFKEKFEKEIKDLECSEKEAKAKYAESRSKLLESEEAVIDLKATVRHLEAQIKEAQKVRQVSKKLEEERSNIRQTITEDVHQEVSNLEQEIERLKTERDAELQQVYARVKVAVARKDETLADLSRDHVALKEKCKYLESMLEQQRKEYLIK